MAEKQKDRTPKRQNDGKVEREIDRKTERLKERNKYRKTTTVRVKGNIRKTK